MAFHPGNLKRLEKHLHIDPQLLERRFALRDIDPAERGCPREGGMHWTPIDGTTLLHLAIDFRKREIFDWLLARGVDVMYARTFFSTGARHRHGTSHATSRRLSQRAAFLIKVGSVNPRFRHELLFNPNCHRL
jgi:hypothetical protein